MSVARDKVIEALDRYIEFMETNKNCKPSVLRVTPKQFRDLAFKHNKPPVYRGIEVRVSE